MNQLRLFPLLLAFSVFAQPLMAEGNCQAELSGLTAGAKVYDGPDAKTFAFDEQTINELDLGKFASLLDKYIHTPMGRARMRYVLSHPGLDKQEISQRAEIIKYMIENPKEFDDLRNHLAKIRETSEKFLLNFEKLQTEDPKIAKKDAIWASITWALVVLPWTTNLLHAHWTVHVAVSGWGVGYAFWNAMKQVAPRREFFARYRDQFVAAGLSLNAIKQVSGDLAQSLRSNLNVLYQGPQPSGLGEAWLRVNAYFNPADRDLVPTNPSVVARTRTRVVETFNALARWPARYPSVREKVDLGEQGLSVLARDVRLLQKEWTLKLPFQNFNVMPVYNFMILSDKTYWTNYWMHLVHAELVDQKPVLAKVFSSLAEIDFCLGMADLARERASEMSMARLEDADQPTHYSAEQMQNPILALEDPPASARNTVNLGRSKDGKGSSYTLLYAPYGSGATSYIEGVILNQILAQNGLPVFAKNMSLVPGIIKTAMRVRYLRGSSPSTREARRMAEIETVGTTYPHTYAYIDNPFNSGGDLPGTAARMVMLQKLIDSNTVGMMSSQNPLLITKMRTQQELDMMHMKDFVARPLVDFDRVSPEALAPLYFNRIERSGLSHETVEEMRVIYEGLRAEAAAGGSPTIH